MSHVQTLRAFMNERLAAAVEDIFVLFERTIVEYEKELCRAEEENQRKQQLLDKVLNPRIELVKVNLQIPSTSPGPGQNQEITETSWIKEEPEEQRVKHEEAQLSVPVLESSAVDVKAEELLLQQRQTEHQEETQGEDVSTEPQFLSNIKEVTEHSSDTDKDEDREPFKCSAVQMETEANGNHYNQVQTRKRSTTLSPQNKSAPETTVHRKHISNAHREGAEKKHQCTFCIKSFGKKDSLQNHIRVHTGERPYSCSICKKSFAQKGNLDTHKRIHTGEKPFSCSICKKKFTQKTYLKKHIKTHMGEISPLFKL